MNESTMELSPVAEPAIFAWKLDPKVFKKSIFTGKKVNEFVDLDMLQGFIKTKMGVALDDPKWSFRHELEQMAKYRQLYDPKLSVFKTTHSLLKYKWGRIVPKGNLSLSVFCRSTRHSFARKKYVDIDMMNSSPSIFCDVARQHGIQLPHLSQYIKDCKEIRQQIMDHHGCSKDVAKSLPIILTYGGSYDTWMHKYKIATNADRKLDICVGIESEMSSLREIVWSENQHIYKDVVKEEPDKWKDRSEAKRGLMAIWCYSIEKYCQESAILFLNENFNYQIANAVPCQDGFMIVKYHDNDDYYDEMCSEISDHMRAKCNIDVRFSVKSMDEGFEIPCVSAERTMDEWKDCLSTRLLANRLIELFKDHIMVTTQSSGTAEVISVFVYIKNKWTQESDKRYYMLTEMISTSLYDAVHKEIHADEFISEQDKIDLSALLRKSTSCSSYINDIIRLMIGSIPRSHTEFDSNPFLLGFNNGVFDLTAHCFRPYKYDDFMTMTTGYDFQEPDFTNPADVEMKQVVLDIMTSIQPDSGCMTLLLQILASGLDGIGYQKLALLNGSGGNGKGFIGGMMAKVLGDYYYQPGNGIITDIAMNSCSASPDICSLKNKRYVNFQEVKGKLNGAFLKQLTGGGKFRGRMLHQNPVEFGMTWTTVMEFNQAPSITNAPGEAEERRLIDLDFPTIFTTDETKLDGQEENAHYRKANPVFTTELFQLRARHMFMHLLLDVYKQYANAQSGIDFVIPDKIKLQTKEFLDKQDAFMGLFKQSFCFKTTGGVMKFKDIWERVRERVPAHMSGELTKSKFLDWVKKRAKVSTESRGGAYIVKGVEPNAVESDELDL